MEGDNNTVTPCLKTTKAKNLVCSSLVTAPQHAWSPEFKSRPPLQPCSNANRIGFSLQFGHVQSPHMASSNPKAAFPHPPLPHWSNTLLSQNKLIQVSAQVISSKKLLLEKMALPNPS